MFDRLNCVTGEYFPDIVSWILRREKMINPIKNVSPQIEKRRRLIEWTAGVATQFQLATQTLHMSVRYLDVFMSGHSIDVPQLYMVAACSLMIAAKMCERETKIPRISAITNILPYPTSAEDFRTSEMMILSFLHWDLNHPTCCYVAELLLQFSIKPSDLMSCSRRRVKGGKSFQALYDSVQEMKQTFFKVVKEMLDISITESSMMNIVSSVLASAVLQASRAVTGLPWSQDIDSITGHGKQDYQQLVDCLISIHKFQADDEVVVIDEGYLSASINISHSSNINQSNIISSVHQ